MPRRALATGCSNKTKVPLYLLVYWALVSFSFGEQKRNEKRRDKKKEAPNFLLNRPYGKKFGYQQKAKLIKKGA